MSTARTPAIARTLERAVPTNVNVPCDHRPLTGPVTQTIVEFAVQEHVDLIVIGSHGRRGISGLLMGSVAEGVMRGAPCPVLIVKSTPLTEPPDPQQSDKPTKRMAAPPFRLLRVNATDDTRNAPSNRVTNDGVDGNNAFYHLQTVVGT